MLLKSDDPFDVYLNGIDLSNANLDGARLDDTSLANADLSSATLRGAAIRSASLLKANLEGADLCRAELNNTDVTGCRVGGAVFGDTRLLRLDVSHVEGLKGVEHRFDSMVDVETLLRTAKGFERAGDRSAARLFLGQAGVPDHFLSLAFAEC